MKTIHQITEPVSFSNKDNDLLKRILKMQEELGELSAELLKVSHYKPRGDNEDEFEVYYKARLEAVDVLLVAYDIIHNFDITEEELIQLVEEKLPKWKAGIANLNEKLEVRNG